MGLIDHDAGDLIARLNRLQSTGRGLGCSLNLLQGTLRGRKIIRVVAQLLQCRANLVVQAFVPIHQILLLVREQVAIAVGRLHVGDGIHGGVHDALSVLNRADQGRQTSRNAAPRLNRNAKRVLVHVLVHLDLLLQLFQIACVDIDQLGVVQPLCGFHCTHKSATTGMSRWHCRKSNALPNCGAGKQLF
ncbi:MAG: hypothetical protein IPJ18_18830 [Betaproteobacteria bacterium]|nr:hypothetical protein [Betaproteobacteria bacterium]